MSSHEYYSYSQYAGIWENLKRDHQVAVAANRLLHPRIIKAVIKRKWLDLGYKLEISPMTAVLYTSRQHSVITFRLELKHYRSIAKLTTADL